MNTTYSDRNIESWVYSSWGEIVGNRRLKAFLPGDGPQYRRTRQRPGH